MSLKAIHVCFIVLSILLTFGFGVWAFAEGGSGYVAAGAIAAACGIALIVYLISFLRKLKDVGFM